MADNRTKLQLCPRRYGPQVEARTCREQLLGRGAHHAKEAADLQGTRGLSAGVPCRSLNDESHDSDNVSDPSVLLGKRGKRGKYLKIGTWNVRTMLRTGKLENIKHEMKRNELDILGLCEVRWRDEGEIESDGYRIMYTASKAGQGGVAVIVTKEIGERVTMVQRKNERLMMIKVKAEPRDINILQVYMPTSAEDDEAVEGLYEQIEEIMSETKGTEITFVMGDFNAVVGEGEDGKIVGKWGLGVRNERGHKLVEFCKRKK
jgi:uncharacterized protein YqeY